MSSLWDSQYPPKTLHERASAKTKNASPSNTSVPAQRKWPDLDRSKLKKGFNFPDSAVSSDEKKIRYVENRNRHEESQLPSI